MTYLDTQLPLPQILRLLESHGVMYRTVNGRIKALDSYIEPGCTPTWGSHFIDVTDWSAHQLAEWLGY